MHPNAALIERFYAALSARDAAAMESCYAEGARFSDPVFQSLDAAGVRAMWVTMWAMLCAHAVDLTVEVTDIFADDMSGSARCMVTYSFGRTGRRVCNKIDASFEFRGGLIVRHADRFDLWRWSGMALGLKGWLLGWTPLVQNAIRREAMRGLHGGAR